MKSTSKLISWVVVLLLAGGVAAAVVVAKKKKKEAKVETKEAVVARGSIRATISTTGTVEPQNRLELKPPIGGRVEELLVKEGDKVKAGQIIGWLSSTERAALLDAARARGEKELAYWRDVYKATPIISPIDGEVIVRKIEPGQTVGADTAVVVLSDRLIVTARVDETDIGKVKNGQAAEVKLDAYPDVRAAGKVDHISYESKIVNNVTMYEADIVCDKTPEVFRSGMSAEVMIVKEMKEDALLVPDEAVSREKEGNYVSVKDGSAPEGSRRKVTLGCADEKNVEIVEGVKEGDTLVYQKKGFSMDAVKGPGANPFMPFSGRGGGGGRR